MSLEVFLTRKYGLKGRADQIRDFIINQAEDTLEIMGAFIEGEAIDRCIAKTGNLKGSITHATHSEISKVRSPAKQEDAVSKPTERLTVYVGTAVVYAGRIEFGFAGTDSLGRNYNQSAQPYLRPAVLENETKIKKLIKEQMRLR